MEITDVQCGSRAWSWGFFLLNLVTIGFLIATFTTSYIQKPIIPTDFYRGLRDSQLIGMSGYSKEVLPTLESDSFLRPILSIMLLSIPDVYILLY